jgi:hypothetical protein
MNVCLAHWDDIDERARGRGIYIIADNVNVKYALKRILCLKCPGALNPVNAVRCSDFLLRQSGNRASSES